MNRSTSLVKNNSQNQEKVMNPEQFNQVIEAILDGKYSWACVLILRFAGYNPLHFIPYRTYNRITKENSFPKSIDQNLSKNIGQKQLAGESAQQHSSTRGSHSPLQSF